MRDEGFTDFVITMDDSDTHRVLVRDLEPVWFGCPLQINQNIQVYGTFCAAFAVDGTVQRDQNEANTDQSDIPRNDTRNFSFHLESDSSVVVLGEKIQ